MTPSLLRTVTLTAALPPAESVVGVIVKALKPRLAVATAMPTLLVMILPVAVVIAALISVAPGMLPALRITEATPLPFVRAALAGLKVTMSAIV